MKRLFIILCVFFVVVFLSFIALAQYSKSLSSVSLINNNFTACSLKDNCVNSEALKLSPYYIEALNYGKLNSKELNLIIKKTMKDMSAKLETKNEFYFVYTFSTEFFGFIDDFELKIDQDNKRIHFKSSSRVGHSDFGANKKRVEEFKKRFKTNLP